LRGLLRQFGRAGAHACGALAFGSRAVNPYLLVVGLSLGFAIGFLAFKFRLSGHRRTPWLAEFHIFLPTATVPTQDDVMDRLIRSNPFKPGGKPAIVPLDGLFFSDVRLNISVAAGARNPNAFLWRGYTEPLRPEIEKSLVDAERFVIARYASEKPMKDLRYLHFLLHLCAAYLELGNGSCVYDAVSERFWSRNELTEFLATTLDSSTEEAHIWRGWTEGETGGWYATRGLRKVGQWDLATPTSPRDHEFLITQLMTELVSKVWQERTMPEKLQLEAYGDQFFVSIWPRKRENLVRIMRAQEKTAP